MLGGRAQGDDAAPKEANHEAGEEQQPGRESERRAPDLGSLLVGGDALLILLGILTAVAVRLGRRPRS